MAESNGTKVSRTPRTSDMKAIHAIDRALAPLDRRARKRVIYFFAGQLEEEASEHPEEHRE